MGANVTWCGGRVRRFLTGAVLTEVLIGRSRMVAILVGDATHTLPGRI